MKNIVLLLFFFTTAACVSAQNNSANGYILVVGGKQYHTGDTIDKAIINSLKTSAIEIITPDNKKHRPLSYSWAISTRTASGGWGDIWKGATDTNPPGKDTKAQALFDRAYERAEYGSIFFISDLKISATGAVLSTQLPFFLK